MKLLAWIAIFLLVCAASAQDRENVAPNSNQLSDVHKDVSNTTNGQIPNYPASATGLESMMQDMVAVSKRGDNAALASYLNSLVLPNSELWFDAHYGRENCDAQYLAANDCLGPRLALTYSTTAQTLAMTASKTLDDLIDENLTSFEAVNYTEPCANNARILPARNLLSQLTTTPIITYPKSTLIQNTEPALMVWAYNKKEETMIGFFVYSEGGFRYIGNPHPASVEEFASKTAPHERQDSDDLTSETVSSPRILIDLQTAQHTVILHVLINSDGLIQKAVYVRGPLEEKDEAIRAAMQHHFEQPFTLTGVKFATDGCISVVLSVSPPKIDSFWSQVKSDPAGH